MEKITLEKVDLVRNRINVTYEEAKNALEVCDGNVVDAIVYLEKNEPEKVSISSECDGSKEKKEMSVKELKEYLKDLIEKGNISRIKIKKDEKVIVNIPVNAGVAAGVIAVMIPQILAALIIAAVTTKVTIEITKCDGTTEVVNKYIKKVADDVKDMASGIKENIKGKVDEFNAKNTEKKNVKENVYTGDETIYSYTVNFDDDKKNDNDEK
ncbi:DUF4342 domain-containing protein [Clostridium sp. BJN0001]|uniref:DUF4342 domain-containing protein n=1 Tax=Clostridium sp. BJN0001 TaxID=2930219 RepID=UPI001FD1C9CB|nr:DUF4342 domain-containing protein [Clostridium sp. BJN0001]